MVGRLLSFWDGLFSGVMLVSGSVDHVNHGLLDQAMDTGHVTRQEAASSIKRSSLTYNPRVFTVYHRRKSFKVCSYLDVPLEIRIKG